MPRFAPFAGIRYDEDRVRLDDVVAPPYDVISPDEQADLEGRSPYNAVKVELPRDEDGRDRYTVAAGLWQEWRDHGALRQEDEPAFYGYRMTFADEAGQPRSTTGVIGALEVSIPGEGDVLPHEHTTPKPKSDRLDLLRATRANLSPIWGLTLASGLAALAGHPDDTSRCTDDDGVQHELWSITDPDSIRQIIGLVGSAPVVIADGHHRYETALAYQSESGSDASRLIMALIVELADDQLSVRAIHRLVSGLPDGFDLVEGVRAHFELERTDPPDAGLLARMTDAGTLALYTAAGTWLLRPRPELRAAATHDLDSSRLDVALAALPAHELVFQHGWDLATSAVDRGEAHAAFLLRPATVAQIAATGKDRVRMPPKTTFFWPKPRTGLVFRQLEG